MEKKTKKKERSSTIYSVLLDLSLHGQTNKWQLKNALHKSYGNIHQTIKILDRDGLIDKAESKPSKRNPRLQADYYIINMHGLFRLLCLPTAQPYLDQIAEKQKWKLLVFQKWDFFKAQGVDKNIRQAFEIMGKNFEEMVRVATYMPSAGFNRDTEFNESFTKGMIESFAFGLYLLEGYDLAENPDLFNMYVPIWQVCKDDSDLDKWLGEKIRKVRQRAEARLEMVKGLQKDLCYEIQK